MKFIVNIHCYIKLNPEMTFSTRRSTFVLYIENVSISVYSFQLLIRKIISIDCMLFARVLCVINVCVLTVKCKCYWIFANQSPRVIIKEFSTQDIVAKTVFNKIFFFFSHLIFNRSFNSFFQLFKSMSIVVKFFFIVNIMF